MLALLTSRWAAYAGALGLILVALWGIHHHGYTEGVNHERAAQTAALAEARVRYAKQIEHDAKVNEETVNAKDAEIARLARTAADRPVGPVRLCLDSIRPREVPAIPRLAGGTGAAGIAGGNGPRVPGRDPEGPDVGPGLQRLADAYDIRNAQVRALLDRNRKLAELLSEAK